MIIAEQIRAARGLLKLEQQPIADAIGISIATYKRWESGAGPLTGAYDKVAALEQFFIGRGVEFIAENGGGHGVRLAKRKAKRR
jgi:transcriptional regulator with XRE-family HTH domain